MKLIKCLKTFLLNIINMQSTEKPPQLLPFWVFDLLSTAVGWRIDPSLVAPCESVCECAVCVLSQYCCVCVLHCKQLGHVAAVSSKAATGWRLPPANVLSKRNGFGWRPLLARPTQLENYTSLPHPDNWWWGIVKDLQKK